MKAVIALLAAVVLLAIGIPLSRAISNGEEHTITRTLDPDAPRPVRETAKPRPAQISHADTDPKPAAAPR